jgi:hypothetical protein
MDDWEPDEESNIGGDCVSWCDALLWIIPAKVEGNWRLGNETLMLTQQFQHVRGALGTREIADGRLNGRQITFAVGGTEYIGTVEGGTITGTVSTGGSFTARRVEN